MEVMSGDVREWVISRTVVCMLGRGMCQRSVGEVIWLALTQNIHIRSTYERLTRRHTAQLLLHLLCQLANMLRWSCPDYKAVPRVLEPGLDGWVGQTCENGVDRNACEVWA